MPGILGGALLVFMASMDNVSVSLFLADARTNVLPIRMWRMIEELLDVRVAAISGVVIAVTFLIVIMASSVGTWSRSRSSTEATRHVAPGPIRAWRRPAHERQPRGTTIMNETATLDRASARAETCSEPVLGPNRTAAGRFRAELRVHRSAPLPEAEFAERVRRIRREAVLAGHDALRRAHRDMSAGSTRPTPTCATSATGCARAC